MNQPQKALMNRSARSVLLLHSFFFLLFFPYIIFAIPPSRWFDAVAPSLNNEEAIFMNTRAFLYLYIYTIDKSLPPKSDPVA